VLTHHALAYSDYLDSFFVPLLLARSQPYDAVVCTSRTAQSAVSNLLALCAEGVAEQRGGASPRFEGQLPVIPLGVDTDLYRPRDVPDVRHQLDVPLDAFVLLWLGRLSPATKADLFPLIRAYRWLRERNPERETLLALVGSDPEGYGSHLEAYAAACGVGSCVRVERTTPQVPVHLWYSAADVFVSPVDNLQESFGLAAIEAMASGVPQVLSDWDGHRDTVAHGETGFRVRTYWAACDEGAVAHWAVSGDSAVPAALLAQTVACDLGELVGYVEHLLRSPDLRSAMGAASRARALAEFAWPGIVARHVECWRALAEHARRCVPPAPRPARILPAFFRTFAGHASHLLTGNSSVRLPAVLRADGCNNRALLDDAFTMSSGLGPSTQAVERVLMTLVDGGGELTLDALASALERDGWSGSDVRRVVLWGVKYGVLGVP